MNAIYYIGLDIHKKTIAYCIKRIDGALIQQGTVPSERKALQKWLPGKKMKKTKRADEQIWFEVIGRDSCSCQYCRRKAPDVLPEG